MQLVTALRECRRALDTMLDLRGSSGLVGENPLNRFWRDVAIGSRHGAANPFILTDQLADALMPTGAAASESAPSFK